MLSKNGKPALHEVPSLNLYPTMFWNDNNFEETITNTVNSYIEACAEELRQLNKGFQYLKLLCTPSTHQTVKKNITQASKKKHSTLGDFTKTIICIVPIQIVHAENNQFKPLSNGLDMPASQSGNATNIALSINFGMYEYILNSWKDSVKTITSMGKQNTGKSTMLNQMFGTFFDVSGARCTDGVWMTMRIFNSTLYILLDFEGFGSIERQPQEDIFLAVFNSALSSITFLRTESRLDADFINIFTRFSQGVGLVKEATNFFQGKCAIVVKDIDKIGNKDVFQEISTKIQQVIKTNNFFSKMFDAKFNIVLSPVFGTALNFKLSEQLAELTKEQKQQYSHGISWKKDVTLLMAKLYIQDWTSLSKQRIEMYQRFICANIKVALETGCNEGKELLTYTGKLIPDVALDLEAEKNIFILDHEIALQVDNSDGLTILKHHFELVMPVQHNYNLFCQFITAVIARRCKRITSWALATDVEMSQSVVTLIQPILNEFTATWQLCTHNCSLCYYKCLLQQDHLPNGGHNCLGSHKCANKCNYCTKSVAFYCGEQAGHTGNHNCRVVRHVCLEACALRKYAGCSTSCFKSVGHEGTDHLCNSPNHYCGQHCAVSQCGNICKENPDKALHQHNCGETRCSFSCCMPSCPFKCADSHFHTIDNPTAVHLCKHDHLCAKLCGMPGICSYDTSATHQHTFEGKREQFNFLLTQQSPRRLKCAITIHSGMLEHEGVCNHSQEANVVHFCKERCPMCNYLCAKPVSHAGYHTTSHGNMVNTIFISTDDEINFGQHKYVASESGKAEMCNLFCSKLGRGHLHVKVCDKGCERTPQQIQHSKHYYIPDPDTPKDEVIHSLFWRGINWEDPSSQTEKDLFNLCSEECPHPSHRNTQAHSYCTKSVLHPVNNVERHTFSCTHELVHIIAVIDASVSMKKVDIVPTLAVLKEKSNNRLGAVLDSLDRLAMARDGLDDTISVISFNEVAKLIKKNENLSTNLVRNLTIDVNTGLTDYCVALRLLLEELNDVMYRTRKVIVIFLTDGEDFAPLRETMQIMTEIKEACQWSYLWLFLIQFSAEPPAEALTAMHKLVGNDQCELSHPTDLTSLFNQMLHIADKMRQRTDLVVKKKNTN